jgi:hypothetical protein
VRSSSLASGMIEVAGPGGEARKVFIRLVETRVSWGIHVVQNVRLLMGIKPRQGPKFARWRPAESRFVRLVRRDRELFSARPHHAEPCG